MNISVLILTRNEELNLPRCLDAVSWSDDVVVFDSFSSDRTVEIARSYGARVFRRPFDNERDHRTASLRLPFKHPWVFNPDADEVATPEVRDEMLAATRGAAPHAAYRLCLRHMFMGRWLRHASLYPTWLVRLFRPEAVRFERSINLRYVVDGSEGRLENGLLHYSFNNGLEPWIAKHNRYSSAEAEETLKSLAMGKLDIRGVLAADDVRRRRALKELSFRLPCRPSLRFLYMYFLRRGFLDGVPGYHYCRLLSIYEYMIEMKVAELRRRARNLPL
jgi:glycosyltransferase involved in cell wall biosynthesis